MHMSWGKVALQGVSLARVDAGKTSRPCREMSIDLTL